MKKIFLFSLLIVFMLNLDGLMAKSLETNNNSSNGKYIVKRGDCLYRLAKKFDISIDSLVKWNKIRNASLIYINQELIVAQPVVKEIVAQSAVISLMANEENSNLLPLVLNIQLQSLFADCPSDALIISAPVNKNRPNYIAENAINDTQLQIVPETTVVKIDSLSLEHLSKKNHTFQMIQLAIKYEILFNMPGESKYSIQEIVESMHGKITYSMSRTRYSKGPNGTFYSDCSGFTALVAGLYAGAQMPRTTSNIFRKAKRINSDDLAELPVGSFIGWPPSKSKHGHVYVKIGNGLYAHASSRQGKKVGISMTIVTEESIQRIRQSYNLSTIVIDEFASNNTALVSANLLKP